MMDLDEAIQHCEEVADEKEEDVILYHNCATYNQNLYEKELAENTEKECRACADEHRQLAEWLKELKAYKGTWSKLGMWLADTRLAIAPDESVNDVDEELVRVAQVDMIDTVLEWMDEHEVEAKQNCTDCIIDGTDACSRGAGRAVNDEICGDFIPSRSEIPTSCGDAISRQAAISAIEALQLPIMREASTCYQFKFSGMSEAREAVENLPSVTPQQRTGRWIEVIDETDSFGNKTWHHECSICGSDKSGWGTYKYCPDCGAKMEVEE